MSEEKKNVTGNEVDTQAKEQGTNQEAPADNKTETEKVGVFKKVGGFFKKNGKKIGVGVGIAAAFAAGVAADKFGLPNFKKGSDDQTGDPEQ